MVCNGLVLRELGSVEEMKEISYRRQGIRMENHSTGPYKP